MTYYKHNLRIRKYSWFAKKNEISVHKVEELIGSESGVCWYVPSKDEYMILYNDEIITEGHIRWTVAHEFGHYIMNHNKNFKIEILRRSEVSEDTYKVLEKEAHGFASCILAPRSVLDSVSNIIGNLNQDWIVKWCRLSNKAANKVLFFFNTGKKEYKRNFQQHEFTKLFHILTHTIENIISIILIHVKQKKRII